MQKHSNKLLHKTEEPKPKTCNCKNKDKCPIDNNYLEECVMYKATVLNNNNGTEVEYYRHNRLSLQDLLVLQQPHT